MYGGGGGMGGGAGSKKRPASLEQNIPSHTGQMCAVLIQCVDVFIIFCTVCRLCVVQSRGAADNLL